MLIVSFIVTIISDLQRSRLSVNSRNPWVAPQANIIEFKVLFSGFRQSCIFET